jgi:hypothetical protein
MVKISIIALLISAAAGSWAPIYAVQQCHGTADNVDLKKIKSISDVKESFDLFDILILEFGKVYGSQQKTSRIILYQNQMENYWRKILEKWEHCKDIDDRHKIEGEFIDFLEKIKEIGKHIVSIVEGIDNESINSQMDKSDLNDELALEFKKCTDESNLDTDTLKSWATEYQYSKDKMGSDSPLNDPKLYVEQLFEKKREALKKKAEKDMDYYKKKA